MKRRLFICYSYRNANESERTFVVRKSCAEIVEIIAHCLAADLIGVEMKDGPGQANDKEFMCQVHLSQTNWIDGTIKEPGVRVVIFIYQL